jgi:hypothetical protein
MFDFNIFLRAVIDYFLAVVYLIFLYRNLIFIKIKKFFIYFGFFVVFIIYLYLFSLFTVPYALLEIDFIFFKKYIHQPYCRSA